MSNLSPVGPGRLEWRDAPMSPGFVGVVVTELGAHKIAYVGWRGNSRDKPYVVTTTLSGFTNERRVKDVETGKFLAERLLEVFVEMVGATFPPEEST